MNSKENLKAQIAKLNKNGIATKSLNYVRVDPNAQLPTSGEVIIPAGTYPAINSQPGVNPWLYYEDEKGRRISRTALLGERHYSADGTPCDFAELMSRTTYKGVKVDEAWNFVTEEVGGVNYIIPVPKVALKITFGDLGTAFVPSKTSGSEIQEFRKKDHYASLTVSKA